MNPTHITPAQDRLILAAETYRRSSAQLLVALQYDLAAFACLMSNDPKCTKKARRTQAHRTVMLAQRSRVDLDVMEQIAAQVDREAQVQNQDQYGSCLFTSMKIMHSCLQDQFVQHRVRDSGDRPPILVRGTRLSDLVC